MGTRLSNAERTLKRREPFVGRWQLAGFNHDDSSIVEAPHCSWGASVSLVLYASAEELLAQVQPRRGLILEITADGSFSEVADGIVEMPWINVYGEMEHAALPFAGTVLDGGKTALQLRPTVDGAPTWLPPINLDGPTLRYNDGDTRVHDRVSLIKGGDLHRSVRMVTDDAYLTRICLRYERIG